MDAAETIVTTTEGGVRRSGPDFTNDLLASMPLLRRRARALCRDGHRADDLAQETLAKAWQYRQTFAAGSRLEAWLFTIMRHHFYSEGRRGSRCQTGWQLDPAAMAEIERILSETITDPVGPEFMAPPIGAPRMRPPHEGGPF